MQMFRMNVPKQKYDLINQAQVCHMEILWVWYINKTVNVAMAVELYSWDNTVGHIE